MEKEEIDYESIIRGEREGDLENGESEDECMAFSVHYCNNLVEYDKNGEIIGKKKKKKVEMNIITAIQREECYEPFEKNFYPNDSGIVTPEIAEWEKEHGIEVHSLQSSSTDSLSLENTHLPHSCLDFKEMGFPSKLLACISNHRFQTPTPIQVHSHKSYYSCFMSSPQPCHCCYLDVILLEAVLLEQVKHAAISGLSFFTYFLRSRSCEMEIGLE